MTAIISTNAKIVTMAERRAALHLRLRDAIRQATPDLHDALDWLETTDPTLDLDDAKLAEWSAVSALAVFESSQACECVISLMEDAAAQGALDDGPAAFPGSVDEILTFTERSQMARMTEQDLQDMSDTLRNLAYLAGGGE